jgi:hypothetical protein
MITALASTNPDSYERSLIIGELPDLQYVPLRSSSTPLNYIGSSPLGVSVFLENDHSPYVPQEPYEGLYFYSLSPGGSLMHENIYTQEFEQNKPEASLHAGLVTPAGRAYAVYQTADYSSNTIVRRYLATRVDPHLGIE